MTEHDDHPGAEPEQLPVIDGIVLLRQGQRNEGEVLESGVGREDDPGVHENTA